MVKNSGETLVERIKVLRIETLLEGWSKVVRVTYRQLRRNGVWEDQDRDLLDRGDGITALLYNRGSRKIILVRQPRVTATLNGISSGETIEACNGLVEAGESPVACAKREVAEETGHEISHLEPVASIYSSPGGSLEMVHLFLGEYGATTRVGAGGGLVGEGEDIEVMEVDLDQAIQWVSEGVIRDGRTIVLLQHVLIHRLIQ